MKNVIHQEMFIWQKIEKCHFIKCKQSAECIETSLKEKNFIPTSLAYVQQNYEHDAFIFCKKKCDQIDV